MKKRLLILMGVLGSGLVLWLPRWISAQTEPTTVRFSLPEAAVVTVVIEDSQGKRVRNLIRAQPLRAGRHAIPWDGLSDQGESTKNQPLPSGTYRVRGIYHRPLDLRYEFSVYSNGNPPWPTPDNRGHWTADHTPPSAVVYIPEQKQILVASYVAEDGSGLAWLDITGKKIRGQRGLGGPWTGASYLARDRDQSQIYAASFWENKVSIHAVRPQGGRLVGTIPLVSKESPTALTGLAADRGQIVVSLAKEQKLILIDSQNGATLQRFDLADPRGVAFDPQGRILALSGKQLVRLEGSKVVPLIRGLEDPQQILVSDQGELYISDWGKSHQVKVFSSSGQLLRTVGTAGGAVTGVYDPTRMHRPRGMTLTPQGDLWVAEASYTPKRLSVWNKGKFRQGFYGPPKYGGGGTIDPVDPTRFYYAEEDTLAKNGGLEFKLNWQKGTAQLARIYSLPSTQAVTLPGSAPQTPLYVQGRQYMTNAFSSYPIGGAAIAGLWLMEGGRARPIAALGQANNWDLLKTPAFRAQMPEGVDPTRRKWEKAHTVFFAWSDRNHDAQIQPVEVTYSRYLGGGVNFSPDLSVYSSGNFIFKPTGFTSQGVPLYDLNQGQPIGDLERKSADDREVLGIGSWTIATGGPLKGFQKGKALWNYPNLWPSLSASQKAPRPKDPGDLIGTTRLLGPAFTLGQETLWAINGNKGNIYLFTQDGLLVETLFKDQREANQWGLAQAQRGMSLNNISNGEENFWPTITRTKDNKVYLVAGYSSLIRIEGLETIKRLPDQTLRLGGGNASQPGATSQPAPRDQATVALRAQPPVVDGKLNEWRDSPWLDLPNGAKGSVAISGGRLYAAFQTQEPQLLTNTGQDPYILFKTGGALDLMLGTDPQANRKRTQPVPGDLRLLVTVVKGQPKAMLYDAVVPGTTNPVPFSSPSRTVYIDRVDEVSDGVTLAQDGTGNFEFSIPLQTLGWSPRAGQTFKADLGILRGRQGKTVERIYWHNRNTGLVSDIPGEAMLTPDQWGLWRIEGP